MSCSLSLSLSRSDQMQTSDHALPLPPEEVCMLKTWHTDTNTDARLHGCLSENIPTHFSCSYKPHFDSRLPQRNFLHAKTQKTSCNLFINHLITCPKGDFATFSSHLGTILSPNYNKHSSGSSKNPKCTYSHTIPTRITPMSVQQQPVHPTCVFRSFDSADKQDP